MVGGLRVLDPACGDGSWLMGCLEALVAAGSAALQRLRAWVEDAPQARSGGGGELRRLLQRQRAMASSGNRDRFVVEWVLLRCLFGAEEDARAAARARARLAARIGPLATGESRSDAEALADVRVGRLTPEGWSTRTAAAACDAGDGDASGWLAEALGRAWGQVTRARLQGGAELGVVQEGRAEIQRRRAVLARRLGYQVADGGPIALPVQIEYDEVLRHGGFALIRDRATAATGGVEGDRH